MFADAKKSWPLNAWYQAAWSHEVEDKPFSRMLLNEALVLFRDEDDAVHALEDRCCHRATPLRLGEVVPGGLQCGYHGLIFDGAGKCVHIPGQDNIPSQSRVRSFPIVERQEIIWVWMGEAEKADETQLVDYPWLDDHEKWPHKHALYHIDCNFYLLIDNLMDLTHIPFIHRNTIGGGDQKGQVEATMEVTPKDTGVHYIRWMEGIVPPPTYVKGAGFADGIKVDRWQEFEYIAPSTVVQWTGALEEGRGAKENRDQKGGFNLRLYHGVTPETDDTCHYFWTPLNGYKPDNQEATDTLFKDIDFTFQEDVEFLEAQHAMMVAKPDQPLVNTKHDAALVTARKAIDRMIDAERQPPLAAE